MGSLEERSRAMFGAPRTAAPTETLEQRNARLFGGGAPAQTPASRPVAPSGPPAEFPRPRPHNYFAEGRAATPEEGGLPTGIGAELWNTARAADPMGRLAEAVPERAAEIAADLIVAAQQDPAGVVPDLYLGSQEAARRHGADVRRYVGEYPYDNPVEAAVDIAGYTINPQVAREQAAAESDPSVPVTPRQLGRNIGAGVLPGVGGIVQFPFKITSQLGEHIDWTPEPARKYMGPFTRVEERRPRGTVMMPAPRLEDAGVRGPDFAWKPETLGDVVSAPDPVQITRAERRAHELVDPFAALGDPQRVYEDPVGSALTASMLAGPLAAGARALGGRLRAPLRAPRPAAEGAAPLPRPAATVEGIGIEEPVIGAHRRRVADAEKMTARAHAELKRAERSLNQIKRQKGHPPDNVASPKAYERARLVREQEAEGRVERAREAYEGTNAEYEALRTQPEPFDVDPGAPMPEAIVAPPPPVEGPRVFYGRERGAATARPAPLQLPAPPLETPAPQRGWRNEQQRLFNVPESYRTQQGRLGTGGPSIRFERPELYRGRPPGQLFDAGVRLTKEQQTPLTVVRDPSLRGRPAQRKGGPGGAFIFSTWYSALESPAVRATLTKAQKRVAATARNVWAEKGQKMWPSVRDVIDVRYFGDPRVSETMFTKTVLYNRMQHRGKITRENLLKMYPDPKQQSVIAHIADDPALAGGVSPELQRGGKILADVFDRAWQQSNDLGVLVAWRENYVPHIIDWEATAKRRGVTNISEEQRKALVHQYLSERPMARTASFQKQRKHDTFADLRAHGLEPITNAADLAAIYYDKLGRVAGARAVVERIENLQTADGQPLLWYKLNPLDPLDLPPPGYVEAGAAFRKHYAEARGFSDAWVHPNIAQQLSILTDPYTKGHNAAVTALRGLNAWHKRYAMWNPLIHNYNMISNVLNSFWNPRDWRRVHTIGDEIRFDPKRQAEAIRAGMQVPDLVQHLFDIYNPHVEGLSLGPRLSGADPVARFNKWLWETQATRLAYGTWAMITDRMMQPRRVPVMLERGPGQTVPRLKVLKKYPGMPRAEAAKAAAEYVSNSFGNIDPATYTSWARRNAPLFFFARNWTWSNARILAGSFGLVPKNLTKAQRARIIGEYQESQIRSIVMAHLLANVAQKAWLTAANSAGWTDEDPRWAFQNEPRFRRDIFTGFKDIQGDDIYLVNPMFRLLHDETEFLAGFVDPGRPQALLRNKLAFLPRTLTTAWAEMQGTEGTLDPFHEPEYPAEDYPSTGYGWKRAFWTAFKGAREALPINRTFQGMERVPAGGWQIPAQLAATAGGVYFRSPRSEARRDVQFLGRFPGRVQQAAREDALRPGGVSAWWDAIWGSATEKELDKFDDFLLRFGQQRGE